MVVRELHFMPFENGAPLERCYFIKDPCDSSSMRPPCGKLCRKRSSTNQHTEQKVLVSQFPMWFLSHESSSFKPAEWNGRAVGQRPSQQRVTWKEQKALWPRTIANRTMNYYTIVRPIDERNNYKEYLLYYFMF
jgi:hypothetical protein